MDRDLACGGVEQGESSGVCDSGEDGIVRCVACGGAERDAEKARAIEDRGGEGGEDAEREGSGSGNVDEGGEKESRRAEEA